MLPIDSALPALQQALATHRSAVLVAPPGAGKSTGVPLALLDSPWLDGQRLLMLESRRLAARAVASRMAAMLGESVGLTVGYQIRRERRANASTRILVVTEGILNRMLQDDPGLDGVGAVLFDEFHERSAVADTGLALTIAARELLRPDLALLVMSATLDGAAVARLLGNAPVIRSEGRLYPVATSHHPVPKDMRFEAHVAGLVSEALQRESGSLLVFLPGAAEIHRVGQILSQRSLPANVRVHALHGSLPPAAQDAAIAPPRAGERKVVLATNIAETSLTIEGIRVVIDSGWMRTPRFSPRTGMTRLETARISRASADQRRGRAGRLEAGSCWRCWSTAEESGMVPFTRPELLDADLAPLALDLAAAGFADPTSLQWLDAPPAAAFAQARELLQLLGALDTAGALTPHGRALAALGAHPRFGHLLLCAKALNPATAMRAAAVVALLEERDPLRGQDGPPPADLQLRLDAVERDLDPARLQQSSFDQGALARIRDNAAEWRRRIGPLAAQSNDAPEELGLLLAWAFPDRVAQQRGGAGRFVLRNGRGARLDTTDPLAHAQWLVIPELDDTGREARIRLAASVDISQLLQQAHEQTATVDEIRWDAGARAVTARRRLMLGALTVSEGGLPSPNPDTVRAALLDGVRQAGIAALPWSKNAMIWRQRVQALHGVDAQWPDMRDTTLLATLDDWLGPWTDGVKKLDALDAGLLWNALQTMVPAPLRRRVDELAPERMSVPSGSAIAIDYSDPARPLLAVRLQEVFGLRQTPRIAGGQLPLTMQLLSPGYQPVQLTQDLESFWRTGYFDVRKDLRGRYPKHHWPDDPLSAPAVRGPKRRGS